MRLVSILSLGAVIVAAGCNGCEVNQPFEDEGTLTYNMHRPGANCETDGGHDPQDNGDTVDWAHRVDPDDATRCEMTTHWEGTLLDTEEVKKKIQEGLEEAGLPAASAVVFVELNWEITNFRLVDNNDTELDHSALTSYDGASFVEDADEPFGTFSWTLDSGDEPTEPTYEPGDTDSLIEGANEAFAADEPLLGSADVAAYAAIANLAPLAAADGMKAQVDYKVSGIVAVTVGGEEEE